jgi:EAL domain-containing protein (putative c-di-GMP-specific phosphodiesterase class I)
MRDHAVARLRVRQELRDALVADQMVLHYQPVVDLSTERVAGYEALLRWQHPERGLLAPAAFLDELMVGELAAPTTEWVIDRAIADAASRPSSSGFVSINVSPSQLLRPELSDVIGAALTRHRLPAERLWVEVTEEAVFTEAAQLSVLAAVRALGAHVVIDDFGSGYAGLFALRHVPADIVKLDREFTRSLEHDHETRAIVESVVSLCATLGRSLVAEGLETGDDVTVMRELGVPLGQGWQLGRPGPLDSFASCASG